MTEQGKSPLWFSHRGVRKVATENSFKAFQEAVRAGFDGLETDLRATADGTVVLCHDPSFLRVAGVDLPVAECRDADLRGMKLKDGQEILRLDEFLAAFPTLPWIFDIKPEGGMATIAALDRLCEKPALRAKLSKQGRFLFWKRDQRQAFKKLFPEARFAAMETQCYMAGIATLLRIPALGLIQSGLTYALTPEFMGLKLYKKTIIKAYHERGARVIAYLPTLPADFQAAIDAGVDDILSDGFIST